MKIPTHKPISCESHTVGVKRKALKGRKSDPVWLSEVLPAVLRDIRNRMLLN